MIHMERAIDINKIYEFTSTQNLLDPHSPGDESPNVRMWYVPNML